MRGIGYDSEEARIVSDHVIDVRHSAAMSIRPPAKLLNIRASALRSVPPSRFPACFRETEVSALYDGGNNHGIAGALPRVAQATIAKAARARHRP